VLTTCQPSTVWCSRERLPAGAAQPAKARQSCSASDYYYYYKLLFLGDYSLNELQQVFQKLFIMHRKKKHLLCLKHYLIICKELNIIIKFHQNFLKDSRVERLATFQRQGLTDTVSCRSVSASWYIGLELTVRLDAVRI
jgi:hypothetical protein